MASSRSRNNQHSPWILHAVATLIWVFISVCIAPAQSLSAPASSDKAEQEKVGTSACAACHSTQADQLQATVHKRIGWDNPIAAEGLCESCHGNGGEHVASGGQNKTVSFKNLSTEEVSKRCLSCHQKSKIFDASKHSLHSQQGTSCVSCHSIHTPKETEHLLVEKQPELCYSCHEDRRADFQKQFAHRVNAGLMSCSDCHDIHGTLNDSQLKTTAEQNAVCVKCHKEKRGPFIFEHEPVKVDGCTACHTPHGSTNPSLIKTNTIQATCTTCHASHGNPRCDMCHGAIHGSNVDESLRR